MLVRWLLCGVLLLSLSIPARAQPDPEDTVREHFAAITAEEYAQAEQYFSAAFLRAFRADLPAMDRYFLARREQLEPGYEIVDTHSLDDVERETAVVIVEFAPASAEPVGVSERMHYYLVREKAGKGAPLADSGGWAWRIDIFDALSYSTLAEARRRPYLYTREAWPEDESRELRSRQGLFRIQLALNRYFEDQGQYPFRLRGGDNRRDELIGGGYVQERYPVNGFDNRPMRAVEFAERSSGDFSYYAVDADGDNRREDYWLLLHGKIEAHRYFADRDTVYILDAVSSSDQRTLAERFAAFWLGRGGEHLALSPTLLAQERPEPTETLVEPLTAPLTAELPAADTATVLSPIEDGEYLEPVQLTDSAEAAADVAAEADAAAGPAMMQEQPVDVPSVVELLAMAHARVAAQGILRRVGDLHPEPSEQPRTTVGPREPVEQLRVYRYGW